SLTRAVEGDGVPTAFDGGASALTPLRDHWAVRAVVENDCRPRLIAGGGLEEVPIELRVLVGNLNALRGRVEQRDRPVPALPVQLPQRGEARGVARTRGVRGRAVVVRRRPQKA